MWDDKTYRALKAYQLYSPAPFTCPKGCGVILAATRNGWKCAKCDFNESWYVNGWYLTGLEFMQKQTENRVIIGETEIAGLPISAPIGKNNLQIRWSRREDDTFTLEAMDHEGIWKQVMLDE